MSDDLTYLSFWVWGYIGVNPDGSREIGWTSTVSGHVWTVYCAFPGTPSRFTARRFDVTVPTQADALHLARKVIAQEYDADLIVQRVDRYF